MTLRSLVSRYANQTHRRTLLKTGAYRVLMVVITVLVALFVTGQVDQALSIGVFANAIKTGTYYGYERLWAHVSWGTRADAA